MEKTVFDVGRLLRFARNDSSNFVKRFLAGVARINNVKRHNSDYLKDDYTVSEFTFDFNMNDGSTLHWHENIYRRWSNGKVTEERYAPVIHSNGYAVRSEALSYLQPIETTVQRSVPVEVIAEKIRLVETIVEKFVDVV